MSSGTGGAEGARVPRTISEMIERYKDVTGDSYARMSARTRNGGHKGISTASINNFAKGNLTQLPRDRETFEALARLLNVSQMGIVLAFARQLGMEVEAPRFGDLLPPSADSLPAHVLESVNVLIRSMIQLSDHSDPDGSTSRIPQLTEGDAASGRVRLGHQDEVTDPDANEI